LCATTFITTTSSTLRLLSPPRDVYGEKGTVRQQVLGYLFRKYAPFPLKRRHRHIAVKTAIALLKENGVLAIFPKERATTRALCLAS
jgi:hypothetical protein